MSIDKTLLEIADELEKMASEEYEVRKLHKMAHMVSAINGLSILKDLSTFNKTAAIDINYAQPPQTLVKNDTPTQFIVPQETSITIPSPRATQSRTQAPVAVSPSQGQKSGWLSKAINKVKRFFTTPKTTEGWISYTQKQKKQIDDLHVRVGNLLSKKVQLEKEIAKNKQALQDMGFDKEQIEKMNAGLTSKLKETTEQLESVKPIVSQYPAAAEAANRRAQIIEGLNSKIKDQQKNIAELQEKVRAGEMSRAEAQKQIEASKGTIGQLTEQIQGLQQTQQGLGATISQQKTTIGNLEKATQEFNKSLNYHQNYIQYLNNEVDKGRMSLAEAEARRMASEKEVARLGQLVNEYKQQLTETGRQLSEKKQTIEDITGQLGKKEETIKRMGEELEGKGKTIEDLTKRLGKYKWLGPAGLALGLGGGYLYNKLNENKRRGLFS